MSAQPAERVPTENWPAVSLFMTVLNEQPYLVDTVRAALGQDYPGELELVIGLGPSKDRTNEIAAGLAAADPRITLVPNPKGRTACGLNAALAAARHDIVVRLDGHAMIPTDYVRTAVSVMTRTGAENVGGIMAAEGRTPFEHAVARAMTTRLGVGPARFHHGGREGPSDTVYLGVFRRDAILAAGGYDESLGPVEDWDLNYRIRRGGGLVYFTPELHVSYRPRPNFRALSKQYFRYGRWRRTLIRRDPDSVTLRYLAPPTAVVLIAGSLLAALTGRKRALVVPLGYAAGVVGGSLLTGRGLPPESRGLLPLVYATMHGSWGLGFLTAPRELAEAERKLPARQGSRARR